MEKQPMAIEVRGARVHNLKNISVDIPLHRIVGIAGVSGSGKSSLALGVLYAEGSRRYLEALSTYTRRRMTQAEKACVDEVRYIPAALALHQRPGVPGMRSTFGTSTELLNIVRLMFSRLASHRCPNGHYVPPTRKVAAEQEIVCPTCGAHFYAPGAEELAFNSGGACETCGGTGIVRVVDESTLVPDDSLSIDEGAVLPWQTLMWSLMKEIAQKLGVRTDVPFRELTAREKDIVFHGSPDKVHMIYQIQKTGAAGEMDFTYFNAIYTVENALAKVKDEKGMKRVEKFLRQEICPSCHGTRLSDAARAPRLAEHSLPDVCRMTLTELAAWIADVPKAMPRDMIPMAESICESFRHTAARLMELGLGYLTLDRAASTLSTGERQRMQLARAVRNRTTGVLYVLDEPSIGLHPSNIDGLLNVMRELMSDGNSIVLVDHDVQILRSADHFIELGPEAGAGGGTIIAQGTLAEMKKSANSRIGGFLDGRKKVQVHTPAAAEDMFKHGRIVLKTEQIHTVKPLSAVFPQGRLSVVTGVSGSGKTTLILESLIPALEAQLGRTSLPAHVQSIAADGVRQVRLIDAVPIGANVRSTVATYANVHDELRKLYARTPAAKEKGYKAGDFSYNTGKLRCPTCDGTGSISLDVQFLPDVTIDCPDCGGSRYRKEAAEILRVPRKGKQPCSLPALMSLSVDEALAVCSDLKTVQRRLQILHDLGLGYLTLGEATPGLSGGEAQRLKLASDMGRGQEGSVFVFDEPTIGLHPLDVETLLSGRMGSAFVCGVQSRPNCAATIKHFACNNQETNRYTSNSVLGLREIYLKPFEICVREAKPRTVMMAYNLINGSTHRAAENF
ncbi:excinuclease ABC subunit UvrA [Selenomonas felix]|uniref:excinuclease ABC subunit UvrA n=1 Tax=Selenomonas felix TaxID=1944634 RepID=UPI001FEB998F|nr:excinuclease ABC subunit UvrA [Selenomonas felix]